MATQTGIFTYPRLLLALAVVSVPAFAQPAGVPNYHKVDDQVHRGAQPSNEGFQNLAKLGIKTVIDLREADGRSQAEKKVVEAAGMQYVNIPLRGMEAPSAEKVAKVLGYFVDTKSGPVFVHCRRGADRTGTVIACYRITHDHWDNKKALAEARANGMSWIERAMQHYVLAFSAPALGTAAAVGVPASN
jgi:tyrosine-protein phosphatase SIW14